MNTEKLQEICFSQGEISFLTQNSDVILSKGVEESTKIRLLLKVQIQKERNYLEPQVVSLVCHQNQLKITV